MFLCEMVHEVFISEKKYAHIYAVESMTSSKVQTTQVVEEEKATVVNNQTTLSGKEGELVSFKELAWYIIILNNTDKKDKFPTNDLF